MRKVIFSVLLLVVVTGMLFEFSSCEKGGNPHPTISFRLRSDSITYTSTYTALPHDTVFNLFVNANKTGPEGMLKSFKITRSDNGGPDSTLVDATLNTVFFSQFYSYPTGDSGNTHTYTFTVGNAVGLYTSIQFGDTVR